MQDYPEKIAAFEAGRTLTPAAWWPVQRDVEQVVTITPDNGEALPATFARLAHELAAREAELLSLMIYGGLAARSAVEAAMHLALGETRWPVTWVECASCGPGVLAGVQAFAVRGRSIQRLWVGSRIVGSVYEDDGARHCLLGGLTPTAVAGMARGAQVQQMLGNVEWALNSAGFTLADVVRTWFYNDDILGWYGEFNRARTGHYQHVAWRSGSLPASTGIGAANVQGAALTMAAWAVRPLRGGPVTREVGSPLQGPAPAYGSSFSRAVEIDSGGWRRLLISGTASIWPDGTTAWQNDPRKQVDLTMEVIAAMLHARRMDFRHVTRATAYFRRPEDRAHFEAWRRARELEAMPVVATASVICRDALWFELELDAVAPSS